MVIFKMNDICKGCARWKKFGKDCRYHWGEKKICSKRVNSFDEIDNRYEV